jgi:hypothetical protein
LAALATTAESVVSQAGLAMERAEQETARAE